MPRNRQDRGVDQSCTNTKSMEMMEKHLQQISDATAKGRYAIVIMDCASWHSKKLMKKFDNLSIMLLPPYSPGFNPIEQVWPSLRENDLGVVPLNRRKSCFISWRYGFYRRKKSLFVLVM